MLPARLIRASLVCIILVLLIQVSFASGELYGGFSGKEVRTATSEHLASVDVDCFSQKDCTSCLAQSSCKWCSLTFMCSNVTDTCKSFDRNQVKNSRGFNMGVGVFDLWSDRFQGTFGDSCLFSRHEITAAATCPSVSTDAIEVRIAKDFDGFSLQQQNFYSVLTITVQNDALRVLVKPSSLSGASYSVGVQDKSVDEYLQVSATDLKDQVSDSQYLVAKSSGFQIVAVFVATNDSNPGITFLPTSLVEQNFMTTAPPYSIYFLGYAVSKPIYYPAWSSTVPAGYQEQVVDGTRYFVKQLCGFGLRSSPIITYTQYGQIGSPLLYVIICFGSVIVIFSIIVALSCGRCLENSKSRSFLAYASGLSAKQDDSPHRNFLGLKYIPCLSDILGLIWVRDDLLIRQLGQEAFFFFKFSQVQLVFAFILTLISLSALMAAEKTFLGDTPSQTFYPDIAEWTVAIIDYDFSGAHLGILWFHNAVNVLCLVIMVIFFIFVLILSRTKKLDMAETKHEAIVTHATVKISNIRKDMVDNQLFFNHIQGQCNSPDEVLAAYLAWSPNSNLYKWAKRLVDRHMDNEDLQGHHRTRFKRLFDVERSLEKIVQQQSTRHDNWKSSGVGFVVFSSIASSEKYLKSYRKNKTEFSKLLKTSRWKYSKAEHYDDVLWEDLRYRGWCRRQIWINIGFAIMILALIIGTLAFIAKAGIRMAQGRYTHQLNGQQFLSGFLTFVVSFFDVFVAVAINIFTPVVLWAVDLQGWQSRRSKLAAQVVSFTIWQFLFLISPIVVYQFSTALGESYFTFSCFCTILIIKVVLSELSSAFPLSIFMVLISIFTGRLRTGKWQRPQYDYLFSYSKKMMIMLLMVYLGPYNPIVFAAGLLYLLVTYVVDRILILHLYDRSQLQDRMSGRFLSSLVTASSIILFFQPIYMLFPLVRHNKSVWMILYMALVPIGFALIMLIIRLVYRRKTHLFAILSFIFHLSGLKHNKVMPAPENIRENIVSKYQSPLHRWYDAAAVVWSETKLNPNKQKQDIVWPAERHEQLLQESLEGHV